MGRRWGPRVVTAWSSVALRRRTGVDADRRRQTGAQQPKGSVAVVDSDAHRNALDDLGKVAGRVFRGNDAEDCPRRRSEAQHAAGELAARNYVGDKARGLART